MVNEVDQVSLKDSSGNADTINSCEKEQEPRDIKSEASAALPATTGSTAAESGSCGTGEEMTTSRDVSGEGGSVEQPQLDSESANSSTDLDFSELPGGGAVEDESSGTSKISGVVLEPGVVVSESDSKLVPGVTPGVQAAEDPSCYSESTDAKEGSGAQGKRRKKE